MPRATNPSDPANTLHGAELNPLLNPLLAENMSRWAEVYFNNPPELRDAAVVELLRQLEREQSPPQSAYPPSHLLDSTHGMQSPAPTTIPKPEREELAQCRSCGNENPVSHQFCGICGKKLDPPDRLRAVPDLHDQQNVFPEQRPSERTRAEVQPVPEPVFRESERDLFMDSSETRDSIEDSEEEDREPRLSYPPPISNDLSLFQSLRPRDRDEEWDGEPSPSNPYRFYIAAVLAIVILGLGYLAWRGTLSTPASHVASAPPPERAEETAAPAGNPPSANSNNQVDPAPAQKPVVAPPQSAGRATRPQDESRPAHKEELAKNATPTAARIVQPLSAAPGNGADELAMAQRYLDGTGGRGRDGSEAAKWLWKSIAKHNGQANLLLADLYLKGDGVSKNCEQGRVLLDSAARRGVPGAGERLRNLPAFGCH